MRPPPSALVSECDVFCTSALAGMLQPTGMAVKLLPSGCVTEAVLSNVTVHVLPSPANEDEEASLRYKNLSSVPSFAST